MAQQVTIYRDHWGTPHVFGKTDASTIFGFAFAQAEDNFTQMEDDFVFATGRGAEIYGPDLTQEDLLNRTLEIEDHAKDDYTSIDPHMRALCDAFAAGANFYLARHPDVHPRLLTKIEPWYPLAFIRYNYYQNGFARDPKLGEEPSQTAALRTYHTESGSNGWVVSPSHSASGYALLFIDPHLPFYGPGQVYEGHIHSDEGWAFTGYARFGFPFPYIGHNANVGWSGSNEIRRRARLISSPA
ncbi:MAG: penicillin acylase family protein [Terriglobales bacterium]